MAGSTIRADAAIEIIGVSASATTSTIASELGVIVEPTITSTLSSVISLRVLVTALVVSEPSSRTIQLIFSPPIVVGSSSNVFFSGMPSDAAGPGGGQRDADVDVGQRGGRRDQDERGDERRQQLADVHGFLQSLVRMSESRGRRHGLRPSARRIGSWRADACGSVDSGKPDAAGQCLTVIPTRNCRRAARLRARRPTARAGRSAQRYFFSASRISRSSTHVLGRGAGGAGGGASRFSRLICFTIRKMTNARIMKLMAMVMKLP